jgi:hypothetical protein
MMTDQTNQQLAVELFSDFYINNYSPYFKEMLTQIKISDIDVNSFSSILDNNKKIEAIAGQNRPSDEFLEKMNILNQKLSELNINNLEKGAILLTNIHDHDIEIYNIIKVGCYQNAKNNQYGYVNCDKDFSLSTIFDQDLAEYKAEVLGEVTRSDAEGNANSHNGEL